jgi:hypothetical protein
MMIKVTLTALVICAVTTSAFAQTQKPRKIQKPLLTEAQSDTLSMTCSNARSLVLSKPQGVVLKTGSNHWDKYVHDEEACRQTEGVLAPAFVRTRDVPACNIGYTCEDPSD